MIIRNMICGGFIATLCMGCSQIIPEKNKDDRINPKGTIRTSDEGVANWFTKSPEVDGVEGVRADLAYKQLNVDLNVDPIIVAVIDSGVDISHEDLAGRIWINKGETGLDKNGQDKATNRIDDDGNGYADDVHGWNFLGSYDKTGKVVHLAPTTLEVTREMVRLKKKLATGPLTPEEQSLLEKVSKEVTTEFNEAKGHVDKNTQAREAIQVQFEIIKDLLAVTFEDLEKKHAEAIETSDPKVQGAKDAIIEAFNKVISNEPYSVARLNGRIGYWADNVKYYFNETFDPRKEIINDDPTDMSDTKYGNHDVKGPDAGHGTHVAGIISAVRNNGKGIDGIAHSARIMALRAVPNGDEYDKDVALAVRYAVDNGARVINMSFGKSYSPLKSEVDAAFQYAADNDVLIVHAAGNDSQDNDDEDNFPNRSLGDGTAISGWMSVGASTAHKGRSLPASFSNFGFNSVDIFAPGHRIKSTIPDSDQYDTYSGTSMAAPVISGVAAMVLSQYPQLNAQDLKYILMESSRDRMKVLVNRPSDELLVRFGALSITGGVADVFSALQLAATY